MSKIRVEGGTRSSTSKSLCDDCVWATRIQGMTEQQKLVKCNEISRILDFNVEECSAYSQFGKMSLREMKEIAVIVELKDNTVGFYKPEAWKRKRGSLGLPKEYEDEY